MDVNALSDDLYCLWQLSVACVAYYANKCSCIGGVLKTKKILLLASQVELGIVLSNSE